MPPKARFDHRPDRRRLAWWLPRLALAAAATGSCVDRVTNPLGGGTATVDVTVALPTATPAVWYPKGDTLRLAVRRAGLQAPMADTAVLIGDALAATIEVPLAQSVERFVLTAEIQIDDAIFFLAIAALELRVDSDTSIVLQATYVGPAAGAASMELTTTDPTIEPADSTRLVVVVRDSSGDVISNPPVRFASQQPLLIGVRQDGVAMAAADAPADTARLDAFLPTGVGSTTLLRVTRGVLVDFLSHEGGDQQIGAPGETLRDSLFVGAYDELENRVPGAAVTFAVVSGGGAVAPVTVTTDANGRAATEWTLGPEVGLQYVDATAAGASPARFTATASNRFASIAVVSGDGQMGLPGAVLPESLAVQVLNPLEQPVAGVVVRFRKTTAGGSVSPDFVITGATGIARTQLTLGSNTGTETVVATGVNGSDADSVVFTATAGSAGDMTTPRTEHTATLLADGSVLVTGGRIDYTSTPITNSAERYDVAARVFRTTGAMAERRWEHTATLLVDGRVLVAGGGSTSSSFQAVASAELYDPGTGTFSSAGTMIGCDFRDECRGRRGHTATRGANGQVLLVGGSGTVGNQLYTLTTAELYDPVRGTFTATGRMAEQRTDHTATLLADGRVLIAGGYFGGISKTSAEIYSPTTGTFSSAGHMTHARRFHTATLLPDGRVLIVGGQFQGGDVRPAAAEIFDPATGKFTATGSMQAGRVWHEATLLADGRVVITGGTTGGFGTNTRLATVEVYDPVAGVFIQAADMLEARHDHGAVLTSADLLITGGQGPGSSILSSAELYRLLPP